MANKNPNIEEVFAPLLPLETAMLRMLYGIGRERVFQKQAAAEIGCSKNRIASIEKRALLKLANNRQATAFSELVRNEQPAVYAQRREILGWYCQVEAMRETAKPFSEIMNGIRRRSEALNRRRPVHGKDP